MAMDGVWRPLSQRTGIRPVDGPHEGIPTWLLSSLTDWFRARLWHSGRERGSMSLSRSTIQEMERRLRTTKLKPALDARGSQDCWSRFVGALRDDENLFLDALYFMLWHYNLTSADRWPSEPAAMERLLDEGGSAWAVGIAGDRSFRLERRIDKTVRDAATEIMLPEDRASEHLRCAWGALYGRAPSATDGYHEAVRAVEAVAKPVILPSDPKATLGRMIPALRDDPQKWKIVLTEAGKDSTPHKVVLGMMTMLWTSQHDRHGTDDESVPLNVTVEEGRAALHLALTLVQWFRGGVVAKATSY